MCLSHPPSRRTVLTTGLAGIAGAGGLALLGAAPSWGAPRDVGMPPPGSTGAAINAGRGVGDMTGEALGAGMNGYAVLEQSAVGIKGRQRARAFVLGNDPARPALALVVCEIGLMFNAIYREVLHRLEQRLPGVFHDGNLLLTATHTHAAPGGSSGHAMVDLTTLGFRPRTFESNVAGIVDAVVAACADYGPARIAATESTLTAGGTNRSRGSFDLDPEEDRRTFPDAVDPRSVNLQIVRDGELVGVINWFAMHATSMGPDTLIADTDNKGYAAWLWEHTRGVDHLRDGASPGFVAAFAQSTPADITPNTGLEPGVGPGGNPEENTRIHGRNQYEAARKQIDVTRTPLSGPVDVVWKFVDMADVTVRPEFTRDGRTHTTAPGMLGAAFAASSQEDGGGLDVALFQEGARGGNPAIRAINEAVVPPWLKDAHAPKDIVIPAGLVPGTVQQVFGFHLARIGGFHLFTLGFEVTIVSGLRIRRVIADRLGVGIENVLVQGYTNGYGHYVTTPEEYMAQNYEGGATFFGRWTLPAIEQIAAELAEAVRAGRPVAEPGSRRDDDPTGRLPVAPTGATLGDATRPGQTFGQVLVAPRSTYSRGEEVVARFAGANPNNDLRRGDTYLAVERRDGDRWVRVLDDSHWDTIVVFDNTLVITDAEIRWRIGDDTLPGTYRITYLGDAAPPLGAPGPISGSTEGFTVA